MGAEVRDQAVDMLGRGADAAWVATCGSFMRRSCRSGDGRAAPLLAGAGSSPGRARAAGRRSAQGSAAAGLSMGTLGRLTMRGRPSRMGGEAYGLRRLAAADPDSGGPRPGHGRAGD